MVGGCDRETGGGCEEGGKCQLQRKEGREKCEVGSVCMCDEWEEGSEAEGRKGQRKIYAHILP